MALKTQKASNADLRPMNEDDLEQVFRLYAVVFGPEYAQRFRGRWTWAQKENLFPDRSYRWVLTASEGVVGFLAAMPMAYSIGGHRVVAHTPCDYMVHPDYRFHGLKLMRQFFASCPDCVTCDDVPDTIKVTRWLGAQVVGPMVTYTKVLDARAAAARPRFAGLPGVAYGMGTLGLRALDTALLAGAGRPDVRLVPDFDQRFVQLFEAQSRQVPALVARDGAFLQWRYGAASPHASRDILAAMDRDGRLLGYAVLYVTGGERPAAYVLDLHAENTGDFRVERALLAAAVRRARQRGAIFMRYHTLVSPWAPPERLMRRLGFVARSRGRRILMVRLADKSLMGLAGSPANWYYTYGDAEVSHSLA